MQKYLLTMLFAVLTVFAKATIHTVSNYPANLAQYNTIQAAVNASASGDTIYVHGSPTSYGGFGILNKKLAIIGPGYLPDKDLPFTASFIGITINGDLSSGTKIEGLVFTNQVGVSDADSIHFIRNYFDGGYLTLSPNFNATGYRGFVIEGNYFRTNAAVINGLYAISNTTIQNNVFYHGRIQGLQGGSGVIINHNLFYGPVSVPSPCLVTCDNLILSNNIFVKRNAGTSNVNSSFSNNITYLCDENTPWSMNGNVDVIGNVANQNPQMADQLTVEAGMFGLLLNYTIAAGPANNAGSDTKDMGLLYDPIGFYNWANSRVSRLPYLHKMNIFNPVIETGGSITIDIEARRNN